ncbi:hypothetical protein Slin15195_G100140 [Septoria linicola]|uniref:Uncharacterized protein n=1 Tax=Septoria linicola TaxID=215465 RepID=A0A9Q9B1X4_9PEZI|nr:hypothetical protein Slin15195_G100140 [Septoria linicola]
MAPKEENTAGSAKQDAQSSASSEDANMSGVARAEEAEEQRIAEADAGRMRPPQTPDRTNGSRQPQQAAQGNDVPMSDAIEHAQTGEPEVAEESTTHDRPPETPIPHGPPSTSVTPELGGLQLSIATPVSSSTRSADQDVSTPSALAGTTVSSSSTPSRSSNLPSNPLQQQPEASQRVTRSAARRGQAAGVTGVPAQSALSQVEIGGKGKQKAPEEDQASTEGNTPTFGPGNKGKKRAVPHDESVSGGEGASQPNTPGSATVPSSSGTPHSSGKKARSLSGGSFTPASTAGGGRSRPPSATLGNKFPNLRPGPTAPTAAGSTTAPPPPAPNHSAAHGASRKLVQHLHQDQILQHHPKEEFSCLP